MGRTLQQLAGKRRIERPRVADDARERALPQALRYGQRKRGARQDTSGSVQPRAAPRRAHRTGRDQPGRGHEGERAQFAGPVGRVAHCHAAAQGVAEHPRPLQAELAR